MFLYYGKILAAGEKPEGESCFSRSKRRGVVVLPERSEGKTAPLNVERVKHSPEGYFSGSPKYFHDIR